MDNINWQRTRDVLISIIGIFILLWILWTILGQFVEVIIILLLSMAVAFLLTPAVNLLARYQIPRILAVALVYVIVLVAIGGLGYGLIFTLIQQVVRFSDVIATFFTGLPSTLQNIIANLEKQGIPPSNIQAVLDQIQGPAVDFAKSLATNAPNFILVISSAFLNILLVGVLSFYLTLDGKRIRDSIIGIVPRRWLSNVLLFEDALNRVVGNYIRGQLTLALIIGILTSLVCIFTGLGDYALLCGVLAFLFETIPMVGPGLASITPIMLSLLLAGSGTLPRTLEIIIAFVIIQAIESNWLGPRIVGHAVGLHPVAAILALLAGAKLFGVFGALLATPVVAASWVVLASLYRSARGETADQMLSKRRAAWTLRRPADRVGKGQKPPDNGRREAGSHERPTDNAEPPRPFLPVTDSQEQRAEDVVPDESASKQ
ncbi:MAG TPA: AI-2E family transporter [Ktedonosporobacter sp.]|nr:AI-2E family transporter [Ktedonosporobacter sp.]